MFWSFAFFEQSTMLLLRHCCARSLFQFVSCHHQRDDDHWSALKFARMHCSLASTKHADRLELKTRGVRPFKLALRCRQQRVNAMSHISRPCRAEEQANHKMTNPQDARASPEAHFCTSVGALILWSDSLVRFFG